MYRPHGQAQPIGRNLAQSAGRGRGLAKLEDGTYPETEFTR